MMLLELNLLGGTVAGSVWDSWGALALLLVSGQRERTCKEQWKMLSWNWGTNLECSM